jgi:hypothetical protein
MSEPHLSSLALDALDLGQLRGDEEARARAHVETCERCRGDLEIARKAREQFQREVLPRTLPEVLRRQRRLRFGVRRSIWLILPVAVAAAAVLLVWPREVPVGILTKGGGPALHVYARREGRVFLVADGASLAPGDDFRFVVEPAGRRFLLIASVDGAGHAAIYHPYGGTASAPLVAAPRVELPGSIHLDASPGPERLYALLSDEPLDAAPVLERLRAIGKEGDAAIRAHRFLDGTRALAQVSLCFEKALR